MTTKMRALSMLAACGAAATVASARPAPFLINLSGATLIKNFLIAPASTNDFVDANNSGTIHEQLAPFDVTPPFLANQLWQVQYRAIGSVNGFQELVNFGRTYATHGDGIEMNSVDAADNAYNNRSVYVNAGVLQPLGNSSNPGGAPVRELSDGTYQVTTSSDPATTGILVDAAPIDVASAWAISYPGTGDVHRRPGDAGYGLNPRQGVHLDGSPAGFTYDLVNPGNINYNFAAPDANTVYDTPTAFGPIAVMTNYGTGISQMTYSEFRHLNVTGRLVTGENIVITTRDVGSGTRNGMCNSTATDPTWGVGENIGPVATLASQDLLGANFLPGNKGATGRVLATVTNHRLAIGYAGAETGVNNSWLTGNRCDCVGMKNDLNGGTVFARPTIYNVLGVDSSFVPLANAKNGYNIGGEGVFATFGDPRASASGFPYFGDNNGRPKIRNENASAFINNITRSVTAFKSLPGGDPTLFSPGEFLASTLVLLNARHVRVDQSNPSTVIVNPNQNSTLQQFTPTSNVLINNAYANFNANNNGLAPSRTALTGGASYTDGVANGANYRTQNNTVVGNGANMNPGQPLAAVGLRNKICGDFNNDGKRDINDIANLVAAWKDRNGGPAWNDPNACVEILGDFNGDGNFNTADVRYFADGLAMVTTVDSGTALNRKQGFVSVDQSFGGNFFGTTLATPKTYANGDSRGDVANAAGNEARGWAPVGADGAVNNLDIDYVYRQFKNAHISGGAANWSDVNEAAWFDLSADMNGDLVVDQCDVRELVVTILGTQYGDVNLDGVVNAADKAIINASILNPPATAGWGNGDLNGDGVVDTADLGLYRIAACPGNANGDASIDFSDLNLVLSFFGQSGQCIPGSGDCNGDGVVDFTDLNLVLSFFGTACAN